jgi:iron complex transport system permease protein
MYDKKLYSKSKSQKIVFFTIFVAILFVISLASGNSGVALGDFSRLFDEGDNFSLIFFDIRLPRTLAAFFVGASLGLSGALMQGVLKNPLASPFTLGISQASAFGASFAIIVLQIYSVSSGFETGFITALAAFASSMATTFIIITAGKKANMTPESLILFGVAIGAFFSALTMFLQYFADDADAAATLFWTFGDLSKAGFEVVCIIAFVLFFAGAAYFRFFWKLDALMLGREHARSLGIDTQKFTLRVMLGASVLSALSVAFFGIIGFVGLIAPHIVRLLAGSSHKYIIPLSALCGGGLLLFADIFSRTVMLPVVIPVGIFTSLLGAPLFLYFLYNRRR